MTEGEKSGLRRRGFLQIFGASFMAPVPDIETIVQTAGIASQAIISVTPVLQQAMVSLTQLVEAEEKLRNTFDGIKEIEDNPFYYTFKKFDQAVGGERYDSALKRIGSALRDTYALTKKDFATYNEKLRDFYGSHKAVLNETIRKLQLLRSELSPDETDEELRISIGGRIYESHMQHKREVEKALDHIRRELGFLSREDLFKFMDGYCHFIDDSLLRHRHSKIMEDPVESRIYYQLHSAAWRTLGAVPCRDGLRSSLLSEAYAQLTDILLSNARGTSGPEEFNRLMGHEERYHYEDYAPRIPNFFSNMHPSQEAAYQQRNSTIPLSQIAYVSGLPEGAPQINLRVPLIRGLNEEAQKAYFLSAMQRFARGYMTTEAQTLLEHYRKTLPARLWKRLDRKLAVFAQQLLEETETKKLPSPAPPDSMPEPKLIEPVPQEKTDTVCWTQREESRQAPENGIPLSPK